VKAKDLFVAEKKTPLVSVVVPVYNASATLKKCVDSLRKQSYNDIEIILVNNCSTDNSLELCLALASKDDRIVVDDLLDGGVSCARNRGIELAHGDFITFVDADDWIDPNVCELLADLNAKHDYDLFCFSAQYHRNSKTNFSYLFDKDIELLSQNQKEELQVKVFAPQAPIFDYKMNTRFAGSACGKFYKRGILLNNNLRFATETIISEDVLFNTLALDFFHRIGYSRDCFYHYEQSACSAQNRYRPNSEKYFSFVIDKIQEWIVKTEKNQNFIDAANCLFVHYLFGILKEDIFHKDNEIPLKNRFWGLKEILNLEKYSDLLKVINKDYFSLPEKVLIFLMRNKYCRLLSLLLRLYL
jgi:glycosyltransferase involved in cell wall biosynthesis